jgi:membrane-bound lytic murein transglycosylase D
MRVWAASVVVAGLAWPLAAAAEPEPSEPPAPGAVTASDGAPHPPEAERDPPGASIPDGADPAPPPEPDAAEAMRRAREQIDALALGYEVEEDAVALAVEPARTRDTLPALLTSELPPPVSERPETRPPEWITGLALPAFPVRWDDRLVKMLEYYRTDTRGRAQIRAWFERAGRYEAMIRRALREAGQPEDLLYVAMVESAFDPNAVSEASAVGIWQFVSPTARDYGLTEDRWVDERRSPERSTTAAAKFFADLHAEFDSWPLAFAGYNMGRIALLRSLRKYNTNDFWVLARLEAGLPYETIVYVNKILACAVVGHNLERFGLADLRRAVPLDVARVSVPGGTGLGRVAQAAGMPVDDLAALNPELRRKRVPPDVRDWTLRLPAERLARFEKAWPGASVALPSHADHVLRFGERLQDVAEMYGTTTDKLRRLNDLGPDATVRPGAKLRVPDVEPAALAPEEGPVVVGVPARKFDHPDRRRAFYRVTGEETLTDIGAFFRVGVDEIRRWNDVSPDAALPRGLVLQLYVPKSVDLSRAIVLPPDGVQPLVIGSEEFLDFHEAQRGRTRLRYRVKEGDTLARLADRFGLSIGSIARINGFSTSTRLEPNREIIVYVEADPKPSVSPAQAKATGPAKAPPVAKAPAHSKATGPAKTPPAAKAPARTKTASTAKATNGPNAAAKRD